ncbi:galanin receptor 2b-like [Xenia sp. Carnegie-2017]|uniref:galanin receptor 2b-like n=1 Tax=Xenia sp. Carnegie-2017 TaxID=2897299 RepID=UPI001F04C0A9|nr:galanin receptor 2b-like [Xenia sp. Carnegie-2017]
MNLTMADLMILLISIPMDIVPEHISWPYGLFACKFLSPLQDVCLTASALTFSAIALERYFVSKGKAHNERRSAILAIAVIWTTSCLTMGLPMAFYKQLISDDEMVMCDVIWPNKNVANFFLGYMIVLIGGCALIGAVVYCRIRRNLSMVHRQLQKKIQDENAEEISNDSVAEQALALSNLMAILISVYVLCALPFPVFVLLVETGVLIDYKYIYTIYLFTSCLLYGNCLANPLILMFMSRDARLTFLVKESPTKRKTEHVSLEILQRNLANDAF